MLSICARCVHVCPVRVEVVVVVALLTMSSQLGFSLEDYTFVYIPVYFVHKTISRKNKIHFKTVVMEYFVIL